MMITKEWMSIEEFKREVVICSEVMLYLIIDQLETFLYSMNHDNTVGRIPNCEGIHTDDKMSEMRMRLKYAIDQTLRFGIKSPVRNEKGVLNRSYQKWYKYWDTWRKKMSHEEWDKFRKLFPKGNYETMLPIRKRRK